MTGPRASRSRRPSLVWGVLSAMAVLLTSAVLPFPSAVVPHHAQVKPTQECPMIRSEMVASRTEVIAENGVVVGGHMQEAEAGVRMLQEGGNAVDAVVAAAFTGYVVEPASCGVGGYGHMAIYLAECREFVTIDHYVRAPRLARADMVAIAPTE